MLRLASHYLLGLQGCHGFCVLHLHAVGRLKEGLVTSFPSNETDLPSELPQITFIMPQADRKCDSGGGSLEEAGSKLAVCNPDAGKHIIDTLDSLPLGC